MKQKIENVVYAIIIALTCYLYFYLGITSLIFAIPSEILSQGFSILNCILCIIIFPLSAWFIGCMIMATCVVICEIPLAIFHFSAPPKDEATDNAFAQVFRWSIAGAIVIIILSVVTTILFPSEESTPHTIQSDKYLYVDQHMVYHLDKQCPSMSGTFTPMLASDAEGYFECSQCCADLIIEPAQSNSKSQEKDLSDNEPQEDQVTNSLPDGTIKKESTEEELPADDTEEAVEEDTKKEQVYITPTGSKYHQRKCGSGTYYPIDKQEAIDKGYEPCSKCW